MAGMGPAPKTPSTRRRRHKVPGAAKLYVADGKVTVPKLPLKRRDGELWHKETRKRWKAIHESPMAAEYDDADLYGLLDLADLWDRRHKAEDSAEAIKISVEIRLQEQRFGLSPLDRRRLSWEIERGERAETATRSRRNKTATKAATDGEDVPADPRELLA